jgi:hypothetical protein
MRRLRKSPSTIIDVRPPLARTSTRSSTGLSSAAVEEGPFGRQLEAVVGVGHGDDPVYTPILPLGAGEDADVGTGHPVPQLEVVGANGTLAPP